MGVGILISPDPCGKCRSNFKLNGGGNFDIILSMRAAQVNLKFHGGGYFEVPWGGNFSIILSLWTVQVNLKFHRGGILISSYPCGQSKSI